MASLSVLVLGANFDNTLSKVMSEEGKTEFLIALEPFVKQCSEMPTVYITTTAHSNNVAVEVWNNDLTMIHRFQWSLAMPYADSRMLELDVTDNCLEHQD